MGPALGNIYIGVSHDYHYFTTTFIDFVLFYVHIHGLGTGKVGGNAFFFKRRVGRAFFGGVFTLIWGGGRLEKYPFCR